MLDINGKVCGASCEGSFAIEESRFNLATTCSTGGEVDDYTLEVGAEIIWVTPMLKPSDHSGEGVVYQVLGLVAVPDEKKGKPDSVCCMFLVEAREAVGP